VSYQRKIIAPPLPELVTESSVREEVIFAGCKILNYQMNLENHRLVSLIVISVVERPLANNSRQTTVALSMVQQISDRQAAFILKELLHFFQNVNDML
jgi:hypothetical protein